MTQTDHASTNILYATAVELLEDADVSGAAVTISIEDVEDVQDETMTWEESRTRFEYVLADDALPIAGRTYFYIVRLELDGNIKSLRKPIPNQWDTD